MQFPFFFEFTYSYNMLIIHCHQWLLLMVINFLLNDVTYMVANDLVSKFTKVTCILLEKAHLELLKIIEIKLKAAPFTNSN